MAGLAFAVPGRWLRTRGRPGARGTGARRAALSATLVAGGLVVGAPAWAGPTGSPAAQAGPAPAADPDRDPDAAGDAGADLTEDEPPPPRPEKPPRIDGAWVGGYSLVGVGLARVNDLDTGPFTAFGGGFRFGQTVFPWLGLGLQLGGLNGIRSESGARQTMGQGQLAVDFLFIPLAKRRVPLNLRATFGFGGGAVRQEGESGRAGYGGAMFGGAVGYTWFPFAKKRRATRGGGFGIGPELGWVGFTPPAPDRPMSNTFYLAVGTTFYFGS